jgi:hypothetical protein
LIRVGVDAALGKLSRVEEGKRDAEGG